MSELILEEKFAIPLNWSWSSVDEILKTLESGSRPKGGVKEYRSGIPSIGGEHLTSDGSFQFDTIKFVPEIFYDKMSRGHILQNDILIVKDGATTGKTSFISVSYPYEKSAVNEHVFIIRTFDRYVLPHYLFRYISSPLGQKIIKKRISGSAQGGINTSFIRNFLIPIPPLNEQKRIISKIDELVSLIDDTKKIIKNIKLQIPKLLQKIIDDFTMGAIGDSKIYRLGEIADIKGGVTLGRRLKHKTIRLPYLRVANVQDGYLDLREMKTIEVLEGEEKKWFLESGDILLTEGGDRDKLGRGTVWRGQIPNCIHQNHIFRVRLNKELFEPDFVSLFLRSSMSKKYFQKIGKQTVNLASINKTQLSSFEFSCPSIMIQKKLVVKIMQSMSHLNALKKTADDMENKLTVLSNLILCYAFEGKLVPQDPNDASASILLENIKQEKKRLQENQKVIKAKPIKAMRIKNAK